jgi:hypothetical protein
MDYYQINAKYKPSDTHIKCVYESLDKRSRKNVYILYDTPLSVEICNANRGLLFVFADNVERAGEAGQCVIRRCENSVGLRVRISPFIPYTDIIYDKFETVIKNDINILYELNKTRSIVLASAYLEDCGYPITKCRQLLHAELNKFCCGYHYVL